MRGDIHIIGTGVSIPDAILTNSEIKEFRNPNITDEWTREKLGIAQRRIVADGMKTSDLAFEAGRDALATARIAPSSIDLLILATATPDKQAPATACIVQHKMGLSNAAAFDISAVCSGFLFGLTTAASFVKAGQAQRVLLIGADTFSRVTNWSRRDCVFFGDGAGAVVVEASHDPSAFFDSALYTDGSRSNAFTIDSDDQMFSMDAHAVYDAATYAIPRCVGELVRRHSLSADDIDCVVPHQPSINLLRTVAQRTGVPFQKFRTNMDRYANTAGATIPIVLHETVQEGGLKSDDLVLFAAAGAGMTAGAALYRWH